MEVLSRSKKRSTATNPYRHRELYPLSHPHDTAPPGSPQGIASPLLVVGVPLSPPLRTCASLERLQSNNTSFDRSTVKVSKYLLYSPRRSSVQANQRARVPSLHILLSAPIASCHRACQPGQPHHHRRDRSSSPRV
jgi:hypothetical protein